MVDLVYGVSEKFWHIAYAYGDSISVSIFIPIGKSRNDTECTGMELKLWPEQCSNCTNYISCSECIQSTEDGMCEWNIREAR